MFEEPKALTMIQSGLGAKAEAQNAAKTISVVSYKGGVGKTTTAIHLAAYIRVARDKKVLLIDGDLNESALDWHRAGGEGALPFAVISNEEWNDLSSSEREKMTRQHDYLVVDTPARPTEQEMLDLVRSHLLVMPLTPDALSIRAAFKMLADIQLVARKPLNYYMLLNRVPPRPSTMGEEARIVLEQANMRILPGGIRRLSVLEKAALEGTIVNRVRGDKYAGIAWECYREAFKILDL